MQRATNDPAQRIETFSHIGVLSADKNSGASLRSNQFVVSLSARKSIFVVAKSIPLNNRADAPATTSSATAVHSSFGNVFSNSGISTGMNELPWAWSIEVFGGFFDASRLTSARSQYFMACGVKPSSAQKTARDLPLLANRAIAFRQNCSLAMSLIPRLGTSFSPC